MSPLQTGFGTSQTTASPSNSLEPEKETPAWTELQLPFRQLAASLGPIWESWAGGGVSPNLLSEWRTIGLRVVCSSCGLSFSADEINQVALHPPEGAAILAPKLERLRLGYCGRKDCQARYAIVYVHIPIGVDRSAWESNLKSRLAHESQPDPTPPRRKRIHPLRLGSLAFVTLLSCWAAYRLIFFSTQPIPFLKPHSPFTADPRTAEH